MPRDITTDAKNRSLSASLRMVVMAKLEHTTPVYVHTGVGDLVHDGDTYKGIGGFAGMSATEENVIMGATKVDLQLSGVDPANISIAFNQDYQGKPATVWVVFLNDDRSFEGDPVVIFKGFMDNQIINLGTTGTVQLSLVSKFEDWSKSKAVRYNDADHQERHPGDKIFQYAEQVAARQVIGGDE